MPLAGGLSKNLSILRKKWKPRCVLVVRSIPDAVFFSTCELRHDFQIRPVLLTVDFLLLREDLQAAICRGCSRASTLFSPGFGLGEGKIGK